MQSKDCMCGYYGWCFQSSHLPPPLQLYHCATFAKLLKPKQKFVNLCKLPLDIPFTNTELASIHQNSIHLPLKLFLELRNRRLQETLVE